MTSLKCLSSTGPLLTGANETNDSLSYHFSKLLLFPYTINIFHINTIPCQYMNLYLLLLLLLQAKRRKRERMSCCSTSTNGTVTWNRQTRLSSFNVWFTALYYFTCSPFKTYIYSRLICVFIMVFFYGVLTMFPCTRTHIETRNERPTSPGYRIPG